MGQLRMENQRILITGGEGYLGKALIAELESRNTIIHYIGDVRKRSRNKYKDIDCLIHFASPINDADPERTSSTIIEGTVNMVKLAKKLDCRFIFASTMGIHTTDITDIYCTSKLAMENYIKSVYNNYLILRIPRIYSKCRSKGLMLQLRHHKVSKEDLDKKIEFMPLEKFVTDTKFALGMGLSTGVFSYTGLQTETIQKIKEIYT
jgi:nucleoside-diphosphate-sugar epimerase